MAYDIPDEIKYKEKIVGSLDLTQLLYAIGFGLAAFLSFRLPIEGEAKLVIPITFVMIGLGFIFLKFDEKLGDIYSFFANIRRASNNSKAAQKFFEVKEMNDNIVQLDDGRLLSILEVQPVNFALFDTNKKQSILQNYKFFLNQLTTPIQILIRTQKVSLDTYFDQIEKHRSTDELLTSIYADFRIFQENHIEKNDVRERKYYLILSSTIGELDALRKLNETTKITEDKLRSCGLEVERLERSALYELFRTYANDTIEESKLEGGNEEKSNDHFRNIITPTFEILKDRAIVNGEYHRIVKIVGFPRKAYDGWLQSFLTKNENYDISLHITPNSIQSMLTYLHNQIIQQTSDLMMSTSKGTPNPSLENKLADTRMVYDSIYRGEEKIFRVGVYIDAKTSKKEELDILTQKAKANLDSRMMVSSVSTWRMADGIKSTLPIVNDKLGANRDFLSNSLMATFPFISSVNTKKKGIFFAHDIDTLNPIFIDFEGMANKHCFVLGVSGSGKSYTTKYLLMQRLLIEKTKAYILDPNGEYVALTDSLNGQVIKLSRESKSTINLFDMAGEDLGSKKLSLISAFDIICGGITEPQKAVLSSVISLAYSRRGILSDKPDSWRRDPPTFSEIKKVLEEMKDKNENRFADPSIEVLLNRISMYCKGEVFGFLDAQTKIDVEKEVTCFDLSELPSQVKNLMMFAVLELINREVKKDVKPKVILIDEGWALLRSEEAAGYVFNFVKNSRRYNASFVFISQEIEDLQKNEAGMAVLNNCQTKILMKQNSTNLDRISHSLLLNEETRNFLLSARNGQGLLITEQNIQKFQVNASEKLHALITTKPSDVLKADKKTKTTKKTEISLDLEKGIYEKNSLTDPEINYLLMNGFEMHKDRLMGASGSKMYLLKLRHNESKEHAFLCWKIYELLKERFGNAKIHLATTKGVDVSILFDDTRRIAFEVETGTNYDKKGDEVLDQRFKQTRAEFDQLYIIVSEWQEKRRYSKYGTTITRDEIIPVIEHISTGYPQPYQNQ